MMVYSGMTVKRMEVLEVSVRRKMKALTLKLETVTLIGEGRFEPDMLCVLEVSVRRKMKALTLKVETVTLIGEGR